MQHACNNRRLRWKCETCKRKKNLQYPLKITSSQTNVVLRYTTDLNWHKFPLTNTRCWQLIKKFLSTLKTRSATPIDFNLYNRPRWFSESKAELKLCETIRGPALLSREDCRLCVSNTWATLVSRPFLKPNWVLRKFFMTSKIFKAF